MVLSFLYWAVRRIVEFGVLLCAGEDSKEVEILVLRHEVMVLRRQAVRPELRSADRALLAGLSWALPRKRWAAFFVRPDTLLAWHRQLVKRKWSYGAKRGRPRRHGLRDLVKRLAEENPTWGYRRITGELRRLGVEAAPSTVWAILKAEGNVHGTATAASIWTTGVIGVAVAQNRYLLAILLAALNLVALRVLLPLKVKLDARKAEKGDDD